MNAASPNPLVAERLHSLLARYVAEFTVLRGRRSPRASLELDAAFAALRLQQRVRWPQGNPLVDELGLCAADVFAAAAESGWSSTRVAISLQRHAAGVRRLDDVLAAAASLPREAV